MHLEEKKTGILRGQGHFNISKCISIEKILKSTGVDFHKELGVLT